MNWFMKNKFYLLPWIMLLVYLFLADQIYVSYFLTNGKPVEELKTPLIEDGDVASVIYDPKEIYYEGEEVYEIFGWAFPPELTDINQVEKKIVLHSKSQDLIFEPDQWNHTRLNAALPKYSMDLSSAGFRLLVSRSVLKMDNYQIGILLTDHSTGKQYYRLTNTHITRLPNSFRFTRE